VKTGALRDSIGVTASGPEAAVTAAAPYAAFVEYGTSRAPQHPFMTPAADAARQTLPEIVAARLNTVLAEVAHE
jgi:HK97 gp10 family phage protein